MTTGEKAGLWGTTTNTNLDMVEQAVGGYVELRELEKTGKLEDSLK